MKSVLWIVLGASAIVNAVLLVGDPRPGNGARSAAPGGAPASRTGGTAALDGATAGTVVPFPDELIAPVGTSESTGLAAYRDRLRGAGFPEWAVVALVGRRIDAHFDEVRRQRLGPGVIDPFWKSPDPALVWQRDKVSREIRREQMVMRRELLGPLTNPAASSQASRFAFLPAEKAAQIVQLESDYSELETNVRMEGGGRVLLDEDREKLAMIEREKRADLVATLTPGELEAYDLRYSKTAYNVKGLMYNFEPTEAEYRAVFALQKDFDERFPSTPGDINRSQEEMKARYAGETEMKARLKNVLGEQRYLEYEQSSDSGYQTALKIVDRFKLPRENAAAIYPLETEYRKRQSEAQSGRKTQAERSEALAALAAEASARVVALLGEEGAKVFRETGGFWLRNLEQQAQRAASPAPRP